MTNLRHDLHQLANTPTQQREVQYLAREALAALEAVDKDSIIAEQQLEIQALRIEVGRLMKLLSVKGG